MPIQTAWLFFVLPSLSINSFGEGTLVLLAGCVGIPPPCHLRPEDGSLGGWMEAYRNSRVRTRIVSM